jgi:hypothetical protein
VSDDIAPAVGSSTAAPVGDRSYDAVEQTRADRGLSGPVFIQNFDALKKIHEKRGTD